jgi:hypothetical protein
VVVVSSPSEGKEKREVPSECASMGSKIDIPLYRVFSWLINSAREQSIQLSSHHFKKLFLVD